MKNVIKEFDKEFPKCELVEPDMECCIDVGIDAIHQFIVKALADQHERLRKECSRLVLDATVNARQDTLNQVKEVVNVYKNRDYRFKSGIPDLILIELDKLK